MLFSNTDQKMKSKEATSHVPILEFDRRLHACTVHAPRGHARPAALHGAGCTLPGGGSLVHVFMTPRSVRPSSRRGEYTGKMTTVCIHYCVTQTCRPVHQDPGRQAKPGKPRAWMRRPRARGTCWPEVNLPKVKRIPKKMTSAILLTVRRNRQCATVLTSLLVGFL